MFIKKDHYLLFKKFERRRTLHKSHEDWGRVCVMPLPRSKKSAGREWGAVNCRFLTLGSHHCLQLLCVRGIKIVGAAVSILSPFEIRTFCTAFATFYCLSHFICYTRKLRKVQKYKPYPLSPICFHLVI